jgi:hypothetical protein
METAISARDLIRRAEREDWTITRTRGDHLRLEHENATMPVHGLDAERRQGDPQHLGRDAPGVAEA